MLPGPWCRAKGRALEFRDDAPLQAPSAKIVATAIVQTYNELDFMYVPFYSVSGARPEGGWFRK